MEQTPSERYWGDYSRKELLNLPSRTTYGDSVYDAILIVPAGMKHDSGYMCIAIIGVRDNHPVEIAAYPDDVNLFAGLYHELLPSLRIDCSYPQGVLHLWDRSLQFVVGESFSSTEIKTVAKPKNNRT